MGIEDKDMNEWIRKDKYDGSIKIKLDEYVFLYGK